MCLFVDMRLLTPSQHTMHGYLFGIAFLGRNGMECYFLLGLRFSMAESIIGRRSSKTSGEKTYTGVLPMSAIIHGLHPSTKDVYRLFFSLVVNCVSVSSSLACLSDSGRDGTEPAWRSG